MAQKISILGINGSPHKNGGTMKMLKEVLGSAQKHGAKIKLIHLADYQMRPYHGNYNKKPDKESLRFFKEMMKFDGYVFATPVHWLAPSSLMKILIDNLTYLEAPDFELEGKVAGVIAHCLEDGGFETASHLSSVLNHMGVISPPYSIFFRNQNIKRNEDTEWMWKDAVLLGKNMVQLVEMIKNSRPNWAYN